MTEKAFKPNEPFPCPSCGLHCRLTTDDQQEPPMVFVHHPQPVCEPLTLLLARGGHFQVRVFTSSPEDPWGREADPQRP